MPPKKNKSAKPSKNTADADTKHTAGKRKRSDNNDLVLCHQKDSAKKPRLEEEIFFRLLEIPTDILYEICSHLHPLSLLHLSRTCKTIRTILMSEASRYAWRSSFESILLDGIREVRNDLCEPRLATLLFENRCDGCQKPRRGAAMPEFMLRVNMCQPCLENSPEFLKMDDVYEVTRKVAPDYSTSRLSCIEGVTPHGADKGAYCYRVYDRASFIEMLEETKDLTDDEFKTWFAAERENFVLFKDECKQLWEFKAYMDDEAKQENAHRKADIGAQRLKDIVTRFTDAGYVIDRPEDSRYKDFWDDVFYSGSSRRGDSAFDCKRLAMRQVPLTDKEWNKGDILSSLIDSGWIVEGEKLRNLREKKERTKQRAKGARADKRRMKA